MKEDDTKMWKDANRCAKMNKDDKSSSKMLLNALQCCMIATEKRCALESAKRSALF